MIIHLHSKDQPFLSMNTNKTEIKEEDFEASIDKHFPINSKENKENTIDDSNSISPRKLESASKKVANFIKQSIEKKIQYNYNTNLNKKEDEPVVRKPLTEYNIKKIMLKNFEIYPN